MTEERFAYHICQGLNHSLDDISPGALRRLEAARHHALSRQRQEVRQTAPVLAGTAGHGDIKLSVDARFWQMMAILLLLVGMALAVYWQGHQYINDLEDIDSALLADDIPPDAFLDKGFAAWLDSSEE
ncbi:MAG: hypothetical protein H6R18_214 [Proteobacteria bacterium]|nr:hypothetical protein [Pseudomonadota bacterium]